jgi:protein PhnA
LARAVTVIFGIQGAGRTLPHGVEKIDPFRRESAPQWLRLAKCGCACEGGGAQETDMAGDDDYIFDEESGEWLPAGELAAKRAAAGAVEVRDAVGNLLADGDQVTLIKDLEVRGAGQTLKRGTLIPSIRLTGDPQEIDCKYPGIKGLVLRAECVRKR